MTFIHFFSGVGADREFARSTRVSDKVVYTYFLCSPPHICCTYALNSKLFSVSIQIFFCKFRVFTLLISFSICDSWSDGRICATSSSFQVSHACTQLTVLLLPEAGFRGNLLSGFQDFKVWLISLFIFLKILAVIQLRYITLVCGVKRLR